MSDRVDHVRFDLAAYVLGGLEARDRAEVEVHLRSCPECRRELAELAGLPALLSRVPAPPTEAAEPPATAASQASAMTAALARIRRRRRRTVVTLAATFVISGVVALGVAAWPERSEADLQLAVEPVPGAGVEGSVAVTEREWGMSMDISLTDLPDRPGFVLWAVRDDGDRVYAASWRATGDRSVRLESSCYLTVDELDRLELQTPDDELVATLVPRA